MKLSEIQKEAIELLRQLIEIPSYSCEEDKTADHLFLWMQKRNLSPKRHLNNVFAISENFDEGKKTILLNSHHDTVKEGSGWIYDALAAVEEDGKLIGLGSNDAGASAVSLLAAYRYLTTHKNLPFNLIVAITAEEEISGKNGIESLLSNLPKIDLGIVGEPTEMKMALAERGLMVLDVEVQGKTGHAARNEGENAIYKALKDIEWFRSYKFWKESTFLPPVKMSVTQIEAGRQHNVVPDLCKYVVDIRVNDVYKHEEVLEIIKENISGKAIPRSVRLQPSTIPPDHAIVKMAKQLGIQTFGSATMSDQALMQFNTVKIGPGKSERSHTPNEFILISEIEEGIQKYIELLENFNFDS